MKNCFCKVSREFIIGSKFRTKPNIEIISTNNYTFKPNDLEKSTLNKNSQRNITRKICIEESPEDFQKKCIIAKQFIRKMAQEKEL